MEKSVNKPTPRKNFFEDFATRVTHIAGSSYAFSIAFGVVLIWVVTGPIFNYSDSWQLVINTGTTIVTFLMVFLIQKSQNKDALAIQLKLNELVAAHELASNRLVSVEDMTEDELRVLQKYYSKLAVVAKQDGNLRTTHSIEEAEQRSELKKALIEDKNIAGNGELPGGDLIP